MISALKVIYASRRLRACAITMFFIGAIAASIAPYQGLIAIKYFGFSDAQFAAIMIAGAAMSVAASLYVGIITDQWASRYNTALVCALIVSGAFALVYVTRAPWAYLLAACLLIPIGFSLMGQVFAIARVAVNERAPFERDAVMAVIRAGFAVPFIVILPLWSLFITEDADLITLYLAMAVAAAGALLTLIFVLPKDGTEGGVETKSGLTFRQSMAELLHPRVTLRLLLIATLVAANTAYMQTMGLIFDLAHPNGTARTAQLAALIAGLEIPFMALIPLATARASKSTVLLAAALIYSIFLFGFPLLAGTDFVWLLALPAAMGAAALLTLPIAYFQDLLAHRPGASSSLQTVNQVTSQLIAGSVFWVGTALAGYSLVMILAAALAIGAGVILRAADARAGVVQG
ncbi:MFS transporter [Celeribacter arenosi]|uniref:Sugar efflux transporter n=1 Tax=Celeribacter arenosi TaxID=792649 RepID=A0ABP7K105_9RHOB